MSDPANASADTPPAEAAPAAPSGEGAGQPPPDAPAAATSDDFGGALRAAREAAGMSTGALAGRLRLNVRQIEALERSDLKALPTLIYVRGFLRSCARELRIDPAPLLAALDRRAGVDPGAPPMPDAGLFRLARFGDGTRPIVALALLALLVAGVIGSLWPRRASTPSHPVSAVPAPPVADAVPAQPPADVPEATAPAPASAAPLAGHPPLAPVTTALRASSAGTPKSVTAPGARPVRPAPPPATPAAAGAAAEPVPAVPPAAEIPPAAADTADLVLRVKSASWIEVVRADGTTVLSQICPAGSVQSLHAAGPLRLVIGNAAAVDAQYHGTAVDLGRYANANGVARFTLQ